MKYELWCMSKVALPLHLVIYGILYTVFEPAPWVFFGFGSQTKQVRRQFSVKYSRTLMSGRLHQIMSTSKLCVKIYSQFEQKLLDEERH
jgi:hypothetical protein